MITLEASREIATDDDSVGPGDEAGLWQGMGLSRSGLSRFLRKAQTLVGLEGEVEVLLAGDRTLRRLNRAYRGKNKATDVLSFPAAEEFAGGHAGDLAISVDTAIRQAEEHGHTLRDEVRVLLLHGLLHLAGMDHEVDAGEMAAREASLRKALRLPGGLIERVEHAAAVKKQISPGMGSKICKSDTKGTRKLALGVAKKTAGAEARQPGSKGTEKSRSGKRVLA